MQGTASWNIPSPASQAMSCAVALERQREGQRHQCREETAEQHRGREVDGAAPLAQRDDVDRRRDRDAERDQRSGQARSPSPDANIQTMPPTAATIATQV